MAVCGTCHQRDTPPNLREECRRCYDRRYYQRTKVTYGNGKARKDRNWFDWVAVNRAWHHWQGQPDTPPVGRQLTYAEKLHLCYHAMAQGETAPTSLRHLLGGEFGAAKKIVDALADGTITVYARDDLGRPRQPMPPL